MKPYSSVLIFLWSSVFAVAAGTVVLLAIIAADTQLGVPLQLGMPVVCIGLFGGAAATLLLQNRERGRTRTRAPEPPEPAPAAVFLETAVLLSPVRRAAQSGASQAPQRSKAA